MKYLKKPLTRKGAQIGFFGCNGELFCTALADGVPHAPRMTTVDPCPGCGGRHGVAITWRKARPRDLDREPDLIVGEAAS